MTSFTVFLQLTGGLANQPMEIEYETNLKLIDAFAV